MSCAYYSRFSAANLVRNQRTTLHHHSIPLVPRPKIRAKRHKTFAHSHEVKKKKREGEVSALVQLCISYCIDSIITSPITYIQMPSPPRSTSITPILVSNSAALSSDLSLPIAFQISHYHHTSHHADDNTHASAHTNFIRLEG